jgi:hypothetical protein
MAVQKLTRIQAGVETVNGTAVAADTILLCSATFPAEDRMVHLPNPDIGVRGRGLVGTATVLKAHAQGGTLEDADGAYFELFPLLLSACAKGNVTAVEQTTGAGDYLWTFAPPQTGAETLDTFTLELGADDPAAATVGSEIAYCLIPQLTITGDCISGEVHVSATYDGAEIVPTTVTAGLSIPTTEFCVGRLSRIYIDDTWAALGGSEIANSLINWSITINGGAHHKFFGGTTRAPNLHQQGDIYGTANFTFERNAAVRTEMQKYRAGAATYTQDDRYISLQVTGDQIGAGDNQTLRLDMAGYWTDWQLQSGVSNGNSHDSATFEMAYDGTGTQNFQALVTTTISAI